MDKSLASKIDQARIVVEDAFDRFSADRSLIAWSAGKDSTLLLRLVLDVCRSRGLRPPVALDIDQRDQFDELTAFRDRLAGEWEVELLIVRNGDFLDRVESIGDRISVDVLDNANRTALAAISYGEATVAWDPESAVCNQLLKTLPINQAIADRGIEAMFTGIRWDEHHARTTETYFSPRLTPQHMRVHPLLHFSERDIWDATFALDIPYSELYQQGYRSIGTRSGTIRPAAIPAWEQDLDQTSERGGRSLEKERMMEQLRAWGYI